jgi:hypothetical protein
MKKKVKIFNPQYAQGGITQDDIQKYLMSMQQQQPQVTEDNLVDMIYSELTSLGDDSGFVDPSNIDNLSDQLRAAYNLDNDYVYNLVNEVYATLAPSDYKAKQVTVAKGDPTPGLNMGEESEDYEEDLSEENLEENVSTYDDYYGDDTGLSEMKFGGMQKKNFIKNFIKKAQEGMEQTDESIAGNNDILDGRSALVKGFESGVKNAVVKAVAKNQFDKMKQQGSYFAEGGFYDPNKLGDDEAYAHHLNLIAAANKDIFNQPELTMARDGREQRRAARDQRRVGRDVQKVLNNLPGMYPGGFNIYSMPGQIMPEMSEQSQGLPPFTIEGERNIFGGLKSYKASFEGGLPVNYMAGMMMPGRGRRGLFASSFGYPGSFYGQSSYSGVTPGEIIYETVNKETLKEVDKNTPGNDATKVEDKKEETTEGATEGTQSGTTTQTITPQQTSTIPAPKRTVNIKTSPTLVPEYPKKDEVDRKALLDSLEEPEPKPGKNYKEWATKEGGKAVSYEGTYTTGMFGTKRPARYQIVYKPDGTIDKKKSFVAVSQSDYGGVIYVPWDKQGTIGYEEGGAVNNPMSDQFGNLQKFVYGGYDPSVAELDGTNLVDPSDPYTRRFSNGGTNKKNEYQKYVDWYNEDAPEEGMRRAPQQSYQEWLAENYPNEKTNRQNIVPGYNSNFNPQLAAAMMAARMGYPMQTLGRSISPISIQRQMVQQGMPMIAGTQMPFTGMFGLDTRISEIYTDPRRFGKDALHIKFMVPGQEGPLLGEDWKEQTQQQVKEKDESSKKLSPKEIKRKELDSYRSNVKGLKNESKVAIKAGERAQRRNVRRALREDPNAFYEGEPLEGMITPMSDEEYMAKVIANRKDVLPIAPRTGTGTGMSSVFEGLNVPGPNSYQNPRYNTLYKEGMGSGSGMYNVSEEFKMGGVPMFPDGGFVYNNPVDNRSNPVMSDQDFFSVNRNENTIPDYLEWQSTPDQEVDVEYKEKNKLQFQPSGLLPFVGKGARNLRNRLDANMIDKFNTQNVMTSSGREQADELVSQGMYDINSGKEIISGFEGIVGAGKGVGQQTYFNMGGQYSYEEGGEYDLTEDEIQALIDAGVDITLLDGYED